MKNQKKLVFRSDEVSNIRTINPEKFFTGDYHLISDFESSSAFITETVCVRTLNVELGYFIFPVIADS
jgi:hypothetical protein